MAKKRIVARKPMHEGEEEFGFHPETIHKVAGRWLGSADLLLEQVKLRLYYFGLSENTGADMYPFHSHAYAEFLYTLEGEGLLLLREGAPREVEVCRAGHLHVARPGVRHASRWKLAPGKVWRGLILQFDLELLPQGEGVAEKDLSFAQQFAPFYDYFFLQMQNTLQVSPEVHADIAAESAHAHDWLRRYPEVAPAVILASSVKLFGLFSSFLCASGRALGKGIVLPLGNMDRQLARAKEMLSNPLLDEVPISDIARRAGMSLYHFIRAFAKAFAVPPQKFRRTVIMERASKKLIQTDEPIYLIAEQAGFANPSAFSKSFLKHFKKTPVDFRATFSSRT